MEMINFVEQIRDNNILKFKQILGNRFADLQQNEGFIRNIENIFKFGNVDQEIITQVIKN